MWAVWYVSSVRLVEREKSTDKERTGGGREGKPKERCTEKTKRSRFALALPQDPPLATHDDDRLSTIGLTSARTSANISISIMVRCVTRVRGCLWREISPPVSYIVVALSHVVYPRTYLADVLR